jgi:hypothetical protein
MSDDPIPELSNVERKVLARAPVEWTKVDEPDRETLRRLQRMKLVEVRTFPTELRGRDEYVLVEWKITTLGQKALA